MAETPAKRARGTRTSKDPRPKKIEKLRSLINDLKNGLINIPPVRMPTSRLLALTPKSPRCSNRINSRSYCIFNMWMALNILSCSEMETTCDRTNWY